MNALITSIDAELATYAALAQAVADLSTQVSQAETWANRAQYQVSVSETKLASLVALRKKIEIEAAALAYRVSHHVIVTGQYTGAQACLTSAVAKLTSDVCQYTEEIKGITSLGDGLYDFAATIVSSHGEKDMASHGLYSIPETMSDAGGDTIGKRSGIILVGSGVMFPALRSGDSNRSSSSEETTTSVVQSLTFSGSVSLRFAYSSTGDFYVVHPVPSTPSLSDAISTETFSEPMPATSWYGYGGESSSIGNEQAGEARIMLYHNRLDGDAGPFYLVVSLGASGATAGSAQTHITAHSMSGSWVFDESALVLADDADDAYTNTGSEFTGVHAWNGDSDGYVLRLPGVASGTADVVGTDSTYNVFDFALTSASLTKVKVYSTDNIT